MDPNAPKYPEPQPPPYSPNFPASQGYPNPNQGYPNPNQGYPGPNQGYPGPNPYPQPGFAPSQHGPYVPPGYPISDSVFSNPPVQNFPKYPSGGYVPPGYNPPPVVQQPGRVAAPQLDGWMSIPQGQLVCPPGLEYLSMIDQLLVHQKVEVLELLTGFETKNKFTVKNTLGQKVYYAAEDSDCCARNCCGPFRPFEMKIMDNYGNQVINMNRPLACESCCFPCCLQSMEVSAPPGTVIGTIEQEWSLCYPSFAIKDQRGDVVLRISGPLCRFTMCGDVEFKILSKDGERQVGKISKQWSGLLREMFTDSDYFGVTFPLNLDVKMKATLLGALFLIDAMFFEKSGNRESDGVGML